MSIEDKIRSIMNVHGRVNRWRNSYTMEMHSGDITYDKLMALSDALGTKSINLNYAEGCHGYSEYTPGYPGSLTLEITINPS